MQSKQEFENTDEPSKVSNLKPSSRKLPRTPLIVFRLFPEDFIRFERVCRLDGQTRSNIVRDAVRFYLDARENNLLQDRDAKLEKQIKKGFDRLAAMQARANIDIGIIYTFAVNNLPKEKRGEIVATSYKHSVDRLKQKLTKDEQEIRDLSQQ